MAFSLLLPRQWNVCSSSSGGCRAPRLLPIAPRTLCSLKVLAVNSSSSSGDQDHRARSRHGKQFENKQRRRGRPAWMRSPYDSPLRDGNRDRLIGLLTERAAKTLMIYLMETNANVYSWLVNFYKENPIPRNGSWDEVSGEAFLRKLLSMPIEEAKYNSGRDSLFDNVRACGVDPRSIAQRVMDIRSQLAEEFIQELQAVAEENSMLLRETLHTSLTSAVNPEELPTAHAKLKPLAPSSTNSSKSSSDGSQNPNSSSSGDSNNSRSKKHNTNPRPRVSTPPTSWRRYRPPGTPEPTPVAASSDRSSIGGSEDSSSAVSDVDKAAALAALNAALKASDALSAGSGGAAGSHPELQPTAAGADAGATSDPAAAAAAEEGKMDMQDVIARLQRSLDADVAVLTNWSAAAADSGNSEEPQKQVDEQQVTLQEALTTAVVAAADEAAAAADSVNSEEPQKQEDEQQVTLQEALTTAVVAAADEAAAAADSVSSGDLAQQEDEQEQVTVQDALTTAAAAAAVEAMESAAADALAASVPAEIDVAASEHEATGTEAASEAAAATAESTTEAEADADSPAAATSSTEDRPTLPKGWGPRAGVGVSQTPVRNNIVSVKKLTSKATPAMTSADAQQQGTSSA